MLFELRSINRVAVLFAVYAMAFACPFSPAIAEGTLPSGCQLIDNIIVCTDGTGAGDGSVPPGCQLINGIVTCGDGSTGGAGDTCVQVPSTGQQTCLSSDGGLSSGAIPSLGKGLGKVTAMPQQTTGTGWLSRLTGWFAYALNVFFSALVRLLQDLVLFLVSIPLSFVILALNALPVPDWLSGFSMNQVLGSSGPIVGFFLNRLDVAAALGLIGAGYSFRLLRKFLTLFQW